MKIRFSRLAFLTTAFCVSAGGCVPGCHEEHTTSRSRTLQVDEHGHVHDDNDGHDHDHGAEKRISSH